MSKIRDVTMVVCALVTSMVISTAIHEGFHAIFSRGVRHICIVGWNFDHPSLGWGWIFADEPAYWTELNGWWPVCTIVLWFVLAAVITYILERRD